MESLQLRSLVFLCVTLTAGHALGQAFNIDCGGTVGTLPKDSYGAGSFQTGRWNAVSDEADLRDLDGNPTPVRLGFTGGGSAVFDIATATDGDEDLMESVFTVSAGSNLLSIINLGAGRYDLYAYSWGGQLFGPRTVGFTVRNGVNTYIDELTFGATWPGQQVLGETFVRMPVEVLEGRNFLTLSIGGGSSKTFNVLAGLQLVPIPAPGSAAFLFGLAALGARRRR